MKAHRIGCEQPEAKRSKARSPRGRAHPGSKSGRTVQRKEVQGRGRYERKQVACKKAIEDSYIPHTVRTRWTRFIILSRFVCQTRFIILSRFVFSFHNTCF